MHIQTLLSVWCLHGGRQPVNWQVFPGYESIWAGSASPKFTTVYHQSTMVINVNQTQVTCDIITSHFYSKKVELRRNVRAIITRMHSSRMRTGRSLTIFRGGCASWGGVLPGGGACFPGGVCFLRGCVLPGGCVLQGGGILACTEADPPVDRITDMSENITLATTL